VAPTAPLAQGHSLRAVTPSERSMRAEPFEFPQGSTLSPPEGRIEWVEGLCVLLFLCAFTQ